MGLGMSHRCERARAAISLELDGELSAVELAFLERHLLRCARCGEFRAESRTFTEVLRGAPLDRTTRSTVHLAPLRRSRRSAIPRRAVAAASFAVLALGGLYGVTRVEHVTTKPAPAPTRPAYLESPDFELALLRPARAMRGTDNSVAI